MSDEIQPPDRQIRVEAFSCELHVPTWTEDGLEHRGFPELVANVNGRRCSIPLGDRRSYTITLAVDHVLRWAAQNADLAREAA